MMRRALTALTLALLLVATATACGSGSASTEPFIGTWTIESETFPSGNTYTREELEDAGELITLEVRDDGTFDLSDGNRQVKDKWEPTGDTTAKLWDGKTPAKVTLDDGQLKLAIPDGPEMVFTRA